MKTTMDRRWMTLLSVALIATATGCGASSVPIPTPVATAPATSTGPSLEGGGVVASGEVVPAREADVGFAVTGRVDTVAVARGDEVSAGDVLVTLDAALLEARLRQAEAAVAVARADLALAVGEPRPEEVAVLKAQLETAAGALAQAEAQRDDPDLGATEAEVAAAQGKVAAAMAARVVTDEHHDKTLTCVDVEWEGEARTICPLLGPMEEKARFRNQAADKKLDAAQAQLDALLAGGQAEVRAAQAAVWTAGAQRDAVQAELETFRTGATAQEIAAAEAAVKKAEAELQAFRVALEQATLRAPFDGTVAAVEVSRGEAVTPDQPILTLADLRELRVETTDLSERDVVDVALEKRATAYVKALDEEITCRVVAVASQASTVGGDVVYAVTLALDDQPAELRWGMSVEVEIAGD
ncbi:MAG: biotin/lipoyl-binding protein [Anaerolineae bacterium]